MIEWLRLVVPVFASVPPAGAHVTAKPVIALPPLFAGAVKLTVPVVGPVALPMMPVGAPGAVAVIATF